MDQQEKPKAGFWYWLTKSKGPTGIVSALVVTGVALTVLLLSRLNDVPRNEYQLFGKIKLKNLLFSHLDV